MRAMSRFMTPAGQTDSLDKTRLTERRESRGQRGLQSDQYGPDLQLVCGERERGWALGRFRLAGDEPRRGRHERKSRPFLKGHDPGDDHADHRKRKWRSSRRRLLSAAHQQRWSLHRVHVRRHKLGDWLHERGAGRVCPIHIGPVKRVFYFLDSTFILSAKKKTEDSPGRDESSVCRLNLLKSEPYSGFCVFRIKSLLR